MCRGKTVKNIFRSIRDFIIALIILFFSEMVGMMSASAVQMLLPDSGIRDIVYMVINTSVYIVVAFFYDTIYKKDFTHKQKRIYYTW